MAAPQSSPLSAERAAPVEADAAREELMAAITDDESDSESSSEDEETSSESPSDSEDTPQEKKRRGDDQSTEPSRQGGDGRAPKKIVKGVISKQNDVMDNFSEANALRQSWKNKTFALKITYDRHRGHVVSVSVSYTHLRAHET